MPDVGQSLSHLLQLREENPDYDCLAYRTTRVEPLCAIYGKNILKQLRDHPPETFSLECLLERSRTLFIQADENQTAELRNYNEPGPEV
jgi:molybdopterin-guanine dinucleotide biosynthesis protein A